MVEDAAETGRRREPSGARGSDKRSARRDAKAELDERRIARGVAVGLPVVTAAVALAAGVLVGPAMAMLALAAGMLLGVIALFWASLRILSGDAALSPELEALDASAHAVDALSSKKRMLVRALKDLDNERALGKLEVDDYERLSDTYREELKGVLRRIDSSLEPHRATAEAAAREYLVETRQAEEAARDAIRADDDGVDDGDGEESDTPRTREAGALSAEEASRARVACAGCSTSNERDATFCKKCGASLAKGAAAPSSVTSTKELKNEA